MNSQTTLESNKEQITVASAITVYEHKQRKELEGR